MTTTPTLLDLMRTMHAARRRHPDVEIVVADNLSTPYAIDCTGAAPTIYLDGTRSPNEGTLALFDAFDTIDHQRGMDTWQRDKSSRLSLILPGSDRVAT